MAKEPFWGYGFGGRPVLDEPGLEVVTRGQRLSPAASPEGWFGWQANGLQPTRVAGRDSDVGGTTDGGRGHLRPTAYVLQTHNSVGGLPAT